MHTDLNIIRENLCFYLRNCAVAGDGASCSAPSDVSELPRPDGSWEDIDYADQTRGGTWSPRRHLNRMRGLISSSPDAALRALVFWAERDPVSPNWWHQSIGTPTVLCETVLLLGALVPESLQERLRGILDRSEPGMTAQNRIWLAGIHLMKGLIYENWDHILHARGILDSEIYLAPPGGEGIQPDYSFHQHGPQLQFGNYGLSYFSDMVKWTYVLNRTSCAFSREKIRILEDYFMNGLRWTLYRNSMDLSACGRQIVHGNPDGKYRNLLGNARNLKRAGFLADFDPEQIDTLSGSRYFPSSAYLVHRTPKWFFSVKMCTPGIIGTETVNSENMLGKYGADGASFLKIRGGEYEEALPLWNFRRFPGTTELQDEEPLISEGFRNRQGGASGLSDGNVSMAAIRLRTDRLSADKVFFCFENYAAAMGGGICSGESQNVNTVLDQRLLSGPVRIPSWDGEGMILPPGENLFPGKMSLIHDELEYLLPENGEYHVRQVECRGDWKNINLELPSTPVAGKIFLLFLNHGRRPKNASYFYILHPRALAVPDFRKLKGGDGVYGIYDHTSNTAMVAFFHPGKIEIPEIGLFCSDKPALYLFRGGTVRTADL